MAQLWWFEFDQDGDGQYDEKLPPAHALTWHERDRAKVVKRIASTRGQHAQRTGCYLVRWEARPLARWRLTLWTHDEWDEAEELGGEVS